MPKPRPVVAVIPHYNMPQTLVSLLRQVMAQKYDAVYVLDDNSSNCDIRKVLAQFGPAVRIIQGSQNLGAGRNRNRILQADPKSLQGAILHFLDADVELVTNHIPDKARALLDDERTGEIGGLIVDINGEQYMHNYNPRISWTWFLAVMMQAVLATVASHRPERAKKWRWLYKGVLRDFPNPFAQPKARTVFCLAEANVLIPYDVFKAVGGFSDQLRFHEAQDLAYRLEAKGYSRQFEPTIVVRHLAVKVRGKKRSFENLSGIYTVARQHGLPFR